MKVHQNIVIYGKDLGDRPSRKHSKFCNEGKWNNFIAPLLPNDCKDMTLIEFGSNAGMYLKMAKDMGFCRVVGVEYQSNEYSVSLKYAGCRVINEFVDENFNYDQPPVADVVLLPNFLYHQPVQTTAKMVDTLLRKARMCIVVSVDKPAFRHWNTDGRIEHTREYFKEWEEVGYVEPLSTEGDPHPREGMYGISFKSRLERVPLKEIKRKGEPVVCKDSLVKFVSHLINHNSYDIRRSSYYNEVMKQKSRHQPEEVTQEYLDKLASHIVDIGKEGMKSPIIVNKHNELLDGGHRYVVAKVLEQASILARIL